MLPVALPTQGPLYLQQLSSDQRLHRQPFCEEAICISQIKMLVPTSACAALLLPLFLHIPAVFSRGFQRACASCTVPGLLQPPVVSWGAGRLRVLLDPSLMSTVYEMGQEAGSRLFLSFLASSQCLCNVAGVKIPQQNRHGSCWSAAAFPNTCHSQDAKPCSPAQHLTAATSTTPLADCCIDRKSVV